MGIPNQNISIDFSFTQTHYSGMGQALIDFWIKKAQTYSFFGKGRLTKYQFMRNFVIATIIYWGGATLFTALISFGFGIMLYSEGDHAGQSLQILTPWIIAETLIFHVVSVVIIVFAAVQRFHDANKSGWNSLALAVPILGFVALYYLATADSDESSNEYGRSDENVRRKKLVAMLFVALVVLGVVWTMARFFVLNR